MIGKIKEWILNRLFKGVTIDEITVNKIKTTGEETAYLDLIKLDSRTSNPSLSEGLLWFRSDLDNVYLSPDGSNAVQMLKDGDPVELKDGNYAGALVGISGTATGRAASLDNLDAAVSTRLASADYEAERGTDNAALPSHIDAIKQKATGPAWNQDTDSLEAIRERCDTIAARLA